HRPISPVVPRQPMAVVPLAGTGTSCSIRALAGVARPGILPSFSQSDRAPSLHPIREGAHVVPARRFAAARALLPVASACFAVLVAASPARAQTQAGSCEDAAELAVLSSPLAPWKGAPLRVVFAAEKPLEGELSLIAPDGRVVAKSGERHGGPP